MLEGVITEGKYLLKEWYKYLDTTVPKGVNRKLFTHLKYSNQDRIKEVMLKYPEVDLGLLETQALREYLSKSDEEIIKELKLYYQ